MKWSKSVVTGAIALALLGCQQQQSTKIAADYLITNGQVYLGDQSGPQAFDIAVCQQTICALGETGSLAVEAKQTIDAKGNIVSPGFIDPHTHTLEELLSDDKRANLNYLTQGVTTVINGNDGGGPVDVLDMAMQLEANGIGTNVALFTGHNSIRESVMGRENRPATDDEILQMARLVEQAMQNGALGISTGLYYVPGSYAQTQEVVALAKAAAKYQGVYDTHLRDESTFNIGFLAALDEAIDIAKSSGIHLHLAHIKALGVDVWGQSEQAINKIESAQSQGIKISADQYPWLASGTKLHSAIMPKWTMADSTQAFHQRLNDPELKEKIAKQVKENIRRRGGASALLITAFSDESLVGKTLEDLAKEMSLPPELAAMELVQRGQIRVASFNMSSADLERFITKPWVVTSSDGTNGHPRKYASFPKKYQTYVQDKALLSIDQFIHQSSAKTAQYLNLTDRGLIKTGLIADIIIWDEKQYRANADFSNWNNLSSGMNTVLVNGEVVIKDGEFLNRYAGKFVKRQLP